MKKPWKLINDIGKEQTQGTGWHIAGPRPGAARLAGFGKAPLSGALSWALINPPAPVQPLFRVRPTGQRCLALLLAFPTSEFRTLDWSVSRNRPLRPHQWGSCPGAPPSCGRCAAAQLANPAAACGDGCRSGECGPPVEAACGQGRGTLASAVRCGAASGLPAARLGRRGCGPEAAGGSLHFPARPGVPGAR